MSRKIIGAHVPYCPSLGIGDETLVHVLVQDDLSHTQVAYRAIIKGPPDRQYEAVAMQGQKLTFEQAREHWPSIERRRYQR